MQALAIERHLHLPDPDVEIARARPDELGIADGHQQVRLLVSGREAELYVIANRLVDGVSLEGDAQPANQESNVGTARPPFPSVFRPGLGETLELRPEPNGEG